VFNDDIKVEKSLTITVISEVKMADAAILNIVFIILEYLPFMITPIDFTWKSHNSH